MLSYRCVLGAVSFVQASKAYEFWGHPNAALHVAMTIVIALIFAVESVSPKEWVTTVEGELALVTMHIVAGLLSLTFIALEMSDMDRHGSVKHLQTNKDIVVLYCGILAASAYKLHHIFKAKK